eukprot:1526645-Amphidinium_carterae.1
MKTLYRDLAAIMGAEVQPAAHIWAHYRCTSSATLAALCNGVTLGSLQNPKRGLDENKFRDLRATGRDWSIVAPYHHLHSSSSSSSSACTKGENSEAEFLQALAFD